MVSGTLVTFSLGVLWEGIGQKLSGLELATGADTSPLGMF